MKKQHPLTSLPIPMYTFLPALLLAILFIPPLLFARAQETPLPAYQTKAWVQTSGPIGGLGYDVRMQPDNPDIMYVTDAWAGIFKSTDGGKNWLPSSQGIATRGGPTGDAIPVFSLTIDPNTPQRLWAGTQFYSGVYRSDDGGASWQAMNNGIQEYAPTIRGFTVEPGNSDVVYLMGEVSSWEWNHEQEITGVGTDTVKGIIYKSVDGGQNWRRIWYGDSLARYLWINPHNHDLLYASTGIFDREAANSDVEARKPGGVGVLRSRDGGETWEELNEANGFDPDELTIGSLYMRPDNPDVLLAASGNDPYTFLLGRPLGGVYLTEDGGDSWVEVLDDHVFSAVEFCEGDPQVAYASAAGGVFRSEDGGKSWVQTAGMWWGPPGIVAGFPIDMQCDPRNAQRIFINNYGGGNFLSEDGGETWRDASKGYTGALMSQVAADPNDPDLVYATARSGVFSSQDGGQNWMGLAYRPARAMEALALAVDPQNPLHLLASVGDAGPNPKMSRDGGKSWENAASNLWDSGQMEPGDITTRIRFAPSDSQMVLAAVGDLGCTFGECDPSRRGSGIIASYDGGESWAQTEIASGHVSDIAIAPQNSQRVYAAMIPRRLYRSDDGGRSWMQINADMGEGVLPISSEPYDPEMPAPPANIAALAVDPQNVDKLYASVAHAGVVISEDGGQSWRRATAGMPAENSVVAFAIDSVHPGVIYAGAVDSGMYVSLDSGQSWRELNEGLSTYAVKDLSLSADGRVLYMASEGRGVFRLGGEQAMPPEEAAPSGETAVPPTTPTTPRNHTVCPAALLPLLLLWPIWQSRRRAAHS